MNGIFYPDNQAAVTGQLALWGLKEGAERRFVGGKVIIAPHAAWNISGSVAAAAFASVQADEVEFDKAPARSINRVIILGPCHDSGDEGIYLTESTAFETPLGDLTVDRKLNRKLSSCSNLIRVNDIPHLSEHSLEVLLPLVKYCFPAAKILPVLVSGKRPILVSSLSRALRVILENNIEESLLVISSDVSANSDLAIALSMAEKFRSILSNMDTGAFFALLADGRISACGGAIAAALLKSGLLDGKRFSALSPLIHNPEDDGLAVYYGAFAWS